MKQVLQNLKTGATELSEVPSPGPKAGHLLIRTRASLVSSGTERMLLEFGRASLWEKARQQPDKVRMVWDKVWTDGLIQTWQAVRDRLDAALPLGYCNVGEVLEVGTGVEGFSVGDRVVSNGNHAEVVCVPRNLCARIPDGVSDEAAAFTVLGAIALQGIRLAQPTLGELFVVTGLGLIGLLTVQLLRANGCRVIGIDLDPGKLELARQSGAETVNLAAGEDPLAVAKRLTQQQGVDGVLITAATQSSEPMHQAAQMCRKRGRIVLVGVTGLELSRADFFEKELTFQVSCSYGPGRYDPRYEAAGQDYPYGYVRWTEQRNFEAVLDMLSMRRIDIAPLISHRFDFAEAHEAYALLGGKEPSLGILLRYAERQKDTLLARTAALPVPVDAPPSSAVVVGLIGAGNYASRVLAPALKQSGARLRSIASDRGLSGFFAGRKYGFEQTTTDVSSILSDPAITTVVIATRHDSHAVMTSDALRAGKHVFVEKPLALDREQLAQIERTYTWSREKRGTMPLLMVGFNRRFAPQVQQIKRLLETVSVPKSFIMTVNAGEIPATHWTQDRAIGGGRVVGEACHFVDLLRYLADAPISAVQATAIGESAGGGIRDDKVSFTLRFADGSFGTVHYLANGHRAFPKERLEVFCSGRVLQLDNFRRLHAWGWPGFRGGRLWRQNKGQDACMSAFIKAIEGGRAAPIPFDQLLEVSRWTIQIADESLR
jgi:predicted dehydrogenase/threonine dehydrogenase-like Zn-dependent dehydrogenase